MEIIFYAFCCLSLQTLAHVGVPRLGCPNYVAMVPTTSSDVLPTPLGYPCYNTWPLDPPSLLVKDITQCWAVVQSLIPPPWPSARSAHKDRKMRQWYNVKCGQIIHCELVLK